MAGNPGEPKAIARRELGRGYHATHLSFLAFFSLGGLQMLANFRSTLLSTATPALDGAAAPHSISVTVRGVARLKEAA